MPMTEILVEPRRVTRVFFDCSDAAPDPTEPRRITAAIKEALAFQAEDEGHDEP
jgi:hypothetical protein